RDGAAVVAGRVSQDMHQALRLDFRRIARLCRGRPRDHERGNEESGERGTAEVENHVQQPTIIPAEAFESSASSREARPLVESGAAWPEDGYCLGARVPPIAATPPNAPVSARLASVHRLPSATMDEAALVRAAAEGQPAAAAAAWDRLSPLVRGLLLRALGP